MERLTPGQAKQKIMSYCAYQERCHWEVKEKLYGYGLYKDAVEEILSDLIVEGFLNEERFARQFAGGKFRMKSWGRIKIVQELKARKVSPYLIRQALKEIDPDDYQKALDKLTEKKWTSLKRDQYIVRETKTIRFLMQKGYEIDLIKDSLSQLRRKE